MAEKQNPWETGYKVKAIESSEGSPWETGYKVKEEKRSMLEELGRQLGLTGRYISEGVSETGDLIASPVRGALNLALPESMQIKPITEAVVQPTLEALNVPKPETALEKIIGGASKTLVSTGTGAGIASLSKPVTQTGQAIKNLLTQDMKVQGIAGAGAGAGQEAASAAGLGDGASTLAGLTTAILSPGASKKYLEKPISNIARKITNALPNKVDDTVTNVLQNTLKNNNIKFDDLDSNVVSLLKKDIAEAVKVNPNMSESALKRLVDYRIVGAIPKQGTLTLDPNLITREKNLAKMGVNSQDPQVQKLANIEFENNKILLNNINELGANKALDVNSVGGKMFEQFGKITKLYDDQIDDLYSRVRTSDGKFAPLDGKTFVMKTRANLKSDLTDQFLPSEIKQYLTAIEKGTFDLNVATASQLKSIVSRSLRSPSLDGNVKQALMVVRNNLENVKLKDPRSLGKDALDAEKAARKFTYQYKQLQERIPALKAIYDKRVSPDKFFDRYVLGADTKQLRNTLNFADEPTRQMIKDNILGHIKMKATNGNPDEIAKISGSALRKVLFGKGGIGTEKLKLIFNKEELAKLKAISNVASFEQHIPLGSAVNTSNTASALFGMLEGIGSSALLNKIPLGQAVLGSPARNIVQSSQARTAQNVPGILSTPTQQIEAKRTLAPYISSLLGD